ncbi:hypothetical protein L2E82_51891 [Cichorium intybus]|nr:hypothetical protein L2E82_51891 [Cichorium intybus]
MKGIDGDHQRSSTRRSKDPMNKYPRIRKGGDAEDEDEHDDDKDFAFDFTGQLERLLYLSTKSSFIASKPIENMKGIDGRHQISSARRSKDLVNKYQRIRKGTDAGEDVKNSSLRST